MDRVARIFAGFCTLGVPTGWSVKINLDRLPKNLAETDGSEGVEFVPLRGMSRLVPAWERRSQRCSSVTDVHPLPHHALASSLPGSALSAIFFGKQSSRLPKNIAETDGDGAATSSSRKQDASTATPGQPAAYTFDVQFEVESYLRHQGQSFINRFDANSYLYITRALDHFDVTAAHGSLEQAFANVEAETLSVAFTSDWLFPSAQNREIVIALLRAGKRASYAELTTNLGHDSFLLESEELYTLVRSFLGTPR